MPCTLSDIFPNINSGLSDIGFFFGAGSSKEAGYPLTKELTINVLKKCNTSQMDKIKQILSQEGVEFNIEQGVPDIEEISDYILKHRHIGNTDLDDLETDMRTHIVSEFLSIKKPEIGHHVKLLQLLKKQMANRSETVWIFTTNYDLLIEMAAMRAQIPVYNGFEGVIHRYFDPARMHHRSGIVKGRTFNVWKEPSIRLIKLHGSISWFKEDQTVFEDASFESSHSQRSMVLPRRQKILETMEHPYDKLFALSSQILGAKCKYVVSCGYSFRDQHVNEHLIIPKLRENSIRFTALCEESPSNLETLKAYPSFRCVTKGQYHCGTKIEDHATDIWKFSKFIELLEKGE